MRYFGNIALVNQGAVVFAGDSNIEAWTTLKGDFAPMHVANVGLGGDVSHGVLFRLKEDVIDLNPRAVVIQIGSNDVAAREDLDLYMSNFLLSILRGLRDYNRSLSIVLCKLPPHGQDSSPLYNKDVLNVNYSLDSLVKSDPNLELLDLYQLLSLPDGSFDSHNFQGDKVHMSPTGYKKFHDALIPIFLQTTSRVKLVRTQLFSFIRTQVSDSPSVGPQMPDWPERYTPFGIVRGRAKRGRADLAYSLC